MRRVARVAAWVGLVIGAGNPLPAVTISGEGSFSSNGGLTISGTNDQYGILAVNGPQVNITGAVISVRNPGGPGPIGLVARDEGTVVHWNDSRIFTPGATSGGAFADTGSVIALRGGSIRTDGYGLKVRDATLSATNADIRAATGVGATIFDTPASRPASLRISGGSLSAGDDAFRVVNAAATIIVENGARISPGAGSDLLDVRSTDTKSAVRFVARAVNLSGDVVSDTKSATAVSLADRSVLTGRVQEASLQIDGTSAWTMTGASVLRSLAVAPGGSVQFARPTGGGFSRVVVKDSLSGQGHFGMNVDLGRGRGDELVVEGKSSGTHTLAVTNRGSAAAAGSALRVVDTVDGGARFKLAGEKIESGMFTYRLVQGNGGTSTESPADWYLASLAKGAGSGEATAPELSASGRAIVNTAGAQALTWLSELDTLNQRMGELRLDLAIPREMSAEVSAKGAAEGKAKAPVEAEAKRTGDVWVRGFGRRMNADTGLTGEGFSQYVYGVDLGFDRGFRLDGSWLVTGLYGGWGGASRFFDAGGTGLTESIHGGVYATWVTDSGWYLDGVGKLNYFDNRFDAVSSFGEHSRGHYGNWGFGFSLEGGRQFELGRGWFLEPQVQAAYTHLSAANYDTSDDVSVGLGATEVFQMRAGLSAGRRFMTAWGVVQPYVKTSFVETLSDGGKLDAQGYSERPNLDGAGVEAGAGVMMQVSARAQIYGEYQFAATEKYTQPWSVNGGFRWQW